ncbi:MAG: hypothetical protein JWQ37_586 [Blastococcus sp.]|nr:hypothetical protein [Blastococcus sp.]
MPVPPAVVPQPDVALESLEAGRSLPVRVVGPHRVGHLLEAGEALGMGAHEGDDPGGSLRLDPGRDVDQDEAADGDPALARRHQ